MVLFAIVFDELLDAHFMENYIMVPDKRWWGIVLNAASNMGLLLTIGVDLMVAAAGNTSDNQLEWYSVVAESGTLIIYNLVQYATRLAVIRKNVGSCCCGILTSLVLAIILYVVL